MKKILALALALLMALGCMSITAFAKTGAGTENDPYLFTSLEVNDIIIATDYVKNDTEDILDYEVRFNDQETGKLPLQPDPGQTIQFTFNKHSNDTQFIYKGFDETANFGGGAYVFETAPVPTQKSSGAAEITAKIKTASFEYEMVIPTATTLTEANHENVLLGTDGKVSITNVKNPTDNVSVSYTVDLTNGDLTDGTNTIAATYKYKQGDAQFAAIDGTTKVTVYENATVKDSLVNVTADDTQWKAAPTGTYNATVTFDFTAEQSTSPLPETITVFELLGNDETPWWNGLCLMKATVLTEEWFEEGEFYLINEFYPLAANLELTKNQEGNYSATNECGTITFVMEGNNCTSFVIDNYCYEEIAYNGTYKPEPKVTVGSVVNGKNYSGTSLMNEHPSISTKIENEKFIIVYGSQDLYEIPLSTELSFCGMNTEKKQYIYPNENESVTFHVRVTDGQCTHIEFGVDRINVIE